MLYVSFWSNVTFGCVAMGGALLFIVRSRLLVYSAGSGVNRVHVVRLDLVRGCFVLSRQKLYIGMAVVILVCIRTCVCRCNWDVVCVGHDLNGCTGWW